MNQPDFRQIKAITFDLYGTVVNWEPGLLKAFQSLTQRWVDQGFEFMSAQQQVLQDFDKARQKFQKQRNPFLSYPDIQEQTYRELFAQYKIEPEEGLSKKFATMAAHQPLFDDGPAALAKMKCSGLLLGALSNIDNTSLAKLLEKTDLKNWLNPAITISADEAGAYKPDDSHFILARERLIDLNIKPESEWLHIGNSLHADAEVAESLEIPFVWMNRNGVLGRTIENAPNIKPAHEVSGFEDLVALLKPENQLV